MNRLAMLWLAPLCLLTACESARPPAYQSGLETVVQASLPSPPDQVIACLRSQENVPSYPRGDLPSFRLESKQGADRIYEQWFTRGRRGKWVTSFELSAAANGTTVTVRMPTALTISEGYAQAARELVATCATALNAPAASARAT